MSPAITDTTKTLRHTGSLLLAVALLAISAVMLADYALRDAPASIGVAGAMVLMMGLCKLPSITATRLEKPLRWTAIALIIAYFWLRFAT